MIYQFSPSELDYKTKCSRCFYLTKRKQISLGDFPPPVFSSFDVAQQNYFRKKKVSDLTSELPEGKFLDKESIPGTIISETLKDNKDRPFYLKGRPDLVILFDKGSYGIIDFKTTNLSLDKAENYRNQLEAYAQIFTHPGKLKTRSVPKLSPITKMGVLQFYPHSISSHKDNFSNLKLQMQYSSLKRDVKAFYLLITELIDLLSKPKVPNYSMDCNLCKFSVKQAEFE